jgi:hypothetical protein
MTKRSPSTPALLLSLLFLCLPNHLGATSHYLVRNKDGVWLVSDTLVVKYNSTGSEPELSHICKVGLRKGSMTFARGYFREIQPLLDELNTLSVSDLYSFEMMNSVSGVLLKYALVKRGDDLNNASWQAGIIAVKDETFAAEFYRLHNAQGPQRKEPRISPLGVPDGLGVLADKFQDAANADDEYRNKIEKNPKEELIKILEEEAKAAPQVVGGPYTVFLLHSDGTISDYSEKKYCEIPKDAAYQEKMQPEPKNHN